MADDDHNQAPPAEATLNGLAQAIRDTLDRADKSQRRADDLRITAGQMLLAARQQVAAQQLVWADWLKLNIPDRSERDVRRLLAIAKASDPKAAMATEREMTRTRVAAIRSHSGRTVRPQPPVEASSTVYAFSGDVEQLARHIVRDLSPHQGEEFLDAVRQYVELRRRAIDGVGAAIVLH